MEFVTSRTDDELVAFIQAGRPKSDALNTTGVDMPPSGGNPLLSRHDLLDIIALVRTFEPAAGGGGGDGASSAPGPEDATGAEEEEVLWIPASSVPQPPAGPAGIEMAYIEPPEVQPTAEAEHAWPHHALDPDRPDNAHLFFGLYFTMTGLHGIHVLVGMAMLAWLAFRAIRRHFGPGYFTPVDLGGLYWHIVDLIWIFLFPLLYLIG